MTGCAVPTRSAIVGIVLAAGKSTRLGRPKALLTAPSGETFVARVAGTLSDGGADSVVVVGRESDEELLAQVSALRPGVEFAANPAPDRGQLSSVIVGIEYADARGAEAVVVLPVDTPLVLADTVRAALQAFRQSRAAIVRVTYQGRHGHPVVFGAAVFAEIRAADPSVGAKQVVRRDPGRVLDVEVADPGVLQDVDLPEDFHRLFGRALP